METQREYHYTYYSYEEWGMGYFGSRSCKCLPEEDVKYFGSFKSKTFKPTKKIILKDDYATREEAIVDEIILHDYYDVVRNPHFANRAKQTSTGWTTFGSKMTEEQLKRHTEYFKNNPPLLGKKHSEETKEKLRQINKGKVPVNKGVPHTPETRKKMSEKNKGRTPWNKGKKGVYSDETILKISEGHKGKTPWNKGIPRTEEEKENMRQNCSMKRPEVREKLRQSACKKVYEFGHIDGAIIVTNNMTKFCLDNNLNRNCISNIVHNKTKQKYHKNWTAKIISENL
jgi:hypothetical protein